MENRGRNRPWALFLVLAYALAGASWGLVRTPLGPEEAKDILMGREVLASGAPACPPGEGGDGPLAAAMCEWPGTVVLTPAAAAWAERLGGLPAARLASAAMGLLLVLLVYRIGNAPGWGRRGLVVAGTFVLLGAPLQLFATVHPRVAAALLLGLAMALAEGAFGERRSLASLGLAALAGASLAVAAMASYVAAAFAVPLALALVLWRRDRAAAAFALTMAAALFAYAWIAVRPVWPEIREALDPFRPGGWSLAPGTLLRVFDGLAMPFLLATFALFHRDGRARAAVAMAVAGAAFLVPFASRAAEDAQTAKLLAFAVLAPAAGVGVAHMSEIFASGNPSRRARPLFTAAVLVVVWVFGVHEMRTLRREGPDLSPAVAFLRGDGGGRTVLVDSDSGSPEYVYRYYLEAARPPMRVVPISRADAGQRREAVRRARPDYVVLDEHHSDRSFGAASREYLGQGFAVAATYQMALASGPRSVQVLRRERR
ncbi:MAG TPA: hypothetical protein VFR85_09745 [Anaeromyxobacteraceae bacterium]|nr:hypothetical protein [Anaeromyxobacteraceae bacterium]